jgi:hypothetical protein
MSKKGKDITQVQDQILNQFERTIRSEKYAHTNGTLSAVEMAIREGAKNKLRMEELRKNAKPEIRISHYNPNNPLNGFNQKSLEERKEILKMLKAQEKLNKASK